MEPLVPFEYHRWRPPLPRGAGGGERTDAASRARESKGPLPAPPNLGSQRSRQMAANAAASGGDDGELHVDDAWPLPARGLRPMESPPPGWIP